MIDLSLLFEQLFNGIQYGMLLFLLAAGLTLVFGIMDLMNLTSIILDHTKGILEIQRKFSKKLK